MGPAAPLPPRWPHLVPGDYFRRLSPSDIFPGRESLPLDVDLGCGDGDFLVAMAAAHPERNFLGVERLLGRVHRTARSIAAANLANALVLRLESVYTVAWMLPPGGVSRLYLLFPDPWPKKRHHRRRVFRDPEFLDGLARCLSDNGEFLCKTDDAAYHEDLLEHFQASPAWQAEPWEPDLPPTAFEQHWLAQGRTIHASRWVKSGNPANSG